MRATVIDEACIACGACEEACPEVFRTAETVAVVLLDPVPADLSDKLREAEEACPVEAIQIEV
jgi:ferredoxin